MVGRGRGRRRLDALYWAAVIGGVTGALVLVLPLELPSASCPAPGEGRVLCQLQRGVLAPLTLVVGGLVLGHVLGSVLTGGLPRLVARLRAGERLRYRRGPLRPATNDPMLLAASWTEGGRAGALAEVPKRPRSPREVCPSCLVWMPTAEVVDGCPRCGTACVMPPRTAAREVSAPLAPSRPG